MIKEIEKAYDEQKTPAMAYDRVSTLDQAGTGYSLEHQNVMAQEYANKNDLYIVKFYSAAESAYKEGRKEFNKMLDDALSYGIKDIIFKNTDRLGRNDIDWPRCKKLARDGKLKIHLYELNTIFHKTSTAENEMFLDNTSVMAKYWSNKISQGVKKSYEYKVSQGIPPARPPVGYLYDKENKIFIKDQAYQEMIDYIFKRYDNENISAQTLTDDLNNKGYKTINGKQWHRSKIHYILTNPIYAGFFVYQDIEHNAHHEPYTSREIFENRQSKLHHKFQGNKKRKFEFIFSRFLKYNNAILSGHIKKNKYIYYSNRFHEINFKEEWIIDQIGDILNNIQFTDNFAKILKDEFKSIVNEKMKDTSTIEKQINEKINTLEAKRSKIIDLYADDDIDKDALKYKLHDIRNEITRYKNRLQNIAFDKDAFIIDIAQAIDDLKNISYWFNVGTKDEKAEIIKSMATHIDVQRDNIIVHWKDEYKLLIKEGIFDNALNSKLVLTGTEMGACLYIVRTKLSESVETIMDIIAA
jgi:site-specific DNA recombinase